MGGELKGYGIPRELIVFDNAVDLVVRDAFRGWIRHLSTLAPALGSMILLLFLGGTALLLTLAGADLLATEAQQASLLHVYLRDTATTAQVQTLQNRYIHSRGVVSVVYVSRAAALARARTRPGLGELATAAQTNPFPAELDVQASSLDDLPALDVLARRSAAVDPIVPSSYDRGAYQRVQQLLEDVGLGGLALLTLLLLVSVSVTANGIRGVLIARRDEIQVMRLVGCRTWMIRGPFIVEGALTGTVSGVIAGALLLALALSLGEANRQAMTQLVPDVGVSAAILIALLDLFGGALVGALASVIGLRNLPA